MTRCSPYDRMRREEELMDVSLEEVADLVLGLEQRIAKAIEIASTMKSLDAHQRLMAVLEGKDD